LITFLFSLTVFVGSFLLFMVQPLAGKLILPYLGGAPSVWTACMLFFQTILLFGYLYAAQAIKKVGCEKQSILHILLLVMGFVFLPLSIDFSGIDSAVHQPVTWMLSKLLVSIGFLFFVVSANAPMIQRWYSTIGQKDSDDPYFLYAASNVGSLIALLGYPLVMEPNFRVTDAREIWSVGYLVLTVLVLICSFIVWKGKGTEAVENVEEVAKDRTVPSALDRLKWVFWAFIPNSCMLAVTMHISTDVASIPLMWVVPLAIFLVTFILVFAKTDFWRELDWDSYLAPFGGVFAILYFLDFSKPAWLAIGVYFILLFLVCMSFHSRLAKNRPASEYLNSFFVWMSVGGIFGGIFNSIVAPLLFNTQLEFPLTIVIAMLGISFVKKDLKENYFKKFLFGFLVMLVVTQIFGYFSVIYSKKLFSDKGLALVVVCCVYIFSFVRLRKLSGLFFLGLMLMGVHVFSSDKAVVKIDRSFFGVLRVVRTMFVTEEIVGRKLITKSYDLLYQLRHGTTLHGVERRLRIRPVFPLSYYSREGPIGEVFRLMRINRRAKSVGVVGLGCGTLAYYGRPWQKFDFFEIDPEVIKIASNKKFFSYLASCKADYRILAGDARVNLARKIPDGSYDLLVLDAFSSDAIPVHLLTLEAVELYKRKLKPGGVLAFHISNRFFDLKPVLGKICKDVGLKGFYRYDYPKKYSIKYDWYDLDNISSSLWFVASKEEKNIDGVLAYSKWNKPSYSEGFKTWTDDYSNLLGVYNWN
jgi:SAM-dependent methyltransferase